MAETSLPAQINEGPFFLMFSLTENIAQFRFLIVGLSHLTIPNGRLFL